MKKIFSFLSLALCAAFLLLLCACEKKPSSEKIPNMDYPGFTGEIIESLDEYIAVQVSPDDGNVLASQLVYVSRYIQTDGIPVLDPTIIYKPGDQVHIYYDGTIATSIPGKILTVYAITVLT